MAKVAVDRYVSKVTKPADFDDFWGEVEDQVSRIPLEPR